MDAVLLRPLEVEKAEQYDRDNWGLSPEAIAAAAAKDAQWSAYSHGEEVPA